MVHEDNNNKSLHKIRNERKYFVLAGSYCLDRFVAACDSGEGDDTFSTNVQYETTRDRGAA